MFLFLFLFFSMLLLCSFSRLKEYYWSYYIVPFFFLNAKNLGQSDDAERRKKRGWPYM